MQTGEMMRSITIEELEHVNNTKCCVVDIRPEEQYLRGNFTGAVDTGLT